MIQASELRKGNYVRRRYWNPEPNNERYSFEMVKVEGIHPNGNLWVVLKDKNILKNVSNYLPVLLTDEIFEKCGFEYVEEAGLLIGEPHHCIGGYDDGYLLMPFCTNDKDCYIKIKYLHQLQNICFTLIGSELKINIL